RDSRQVAARFPPFKGKVREGMGYDALRSKARLAVRLRAPVGAVGHADLDQTTAGEKQAQRSRDERPRVTSDRARRGAADTMMADSIVVLSRGRRPVTSGSFHPAAFSGVASPQSPQ